MWPNLTPLNASIAIAKENLDSTEYAGVLIKINGLNDLISQSLIANGFENTQDGYLLKNKFSFKVSELENGYQVLIAQCLISQQIWLFRYYPRLFI